MADEDDNIDYTSERPGEHGDFIDNIVPDHFFVGKRRFDVDVDEAANGVWHATTQVFRAKNGRVYHPDHAPFDVKITEIETVSEAEATPSDAVDALQSAVEAMDEVTETAEGNSTQ